MNLTFSQQLTSQCNSAEVKHLWIFWLKSENAGVHLGGLAQNTFFQIRDLLSQVIDLVSDVIDLVLDIIKID